MDDKTKITYYLKKEKRITTLVVIFGILFNIAQIFQPIMLGYLIDGINDNMSFDIIFKRIIYYVLVVLGIQVFRFSKRLFSRILANKTKIRLRKIIYKHLIEEDIEVILKENIGDIMVRLIGDVDLVSEGVNKGVTEIFDTGVYMISYYTMLMLYDFKITLISCAFVPISIILAYVLKNKIYNATKIYREASSDVASTTLSYINNCLDYRNYGSIDLIYKEYEESLEDLKKKNIKADILEGSMQPIYRIISYLGIIFIIYLGALNVNNAKSYFNGIWTLGVFTAYLKLFLDFAKKSSMVGKTINAVSKAKISFRRIKPYLIDNIKTYVVSKDTKGDLEVTNLTFSYDDKKIINNLSFKASKGDIIGISGGIASGKTTLGKALLGLFSYEGSIKINGIELRDYNKLEKSNLISYMGHDPYLLSDTIYNNIDLGSKMDISEVIKDTKLDIDLLNMKDDINTFVGSGGVMLSGGQQARIALSRALLHKNNLIILDDPFSACDMKTEEEIINNIKDKYKDSIILLISHRLTIFPYTNKVLLLGDEYLYLTHEEMLKKSEYYKNIFETQKGGCIK